MAVSIDFYRILNVHVAQRYTFGKTIITIIRQELLINLIALHVCVCVCGGGGGVRTVVLILLTLMAPV